MIDTPWSAQTLPDVAVSHSTLESTTSDCRVRPLRRCETIALPSERFVAEFERVEQAAARCLARARGVCRKTAPGASPP